jgi:hypothetical protein
MTFVFTIYQIGHEPMKVTAHSFAAGAFERRLLDRLGYVYEITGSEEKNHETK